MKIRCNKCQHQGEISEFRTGRDFFQHTYVAGCPKCDNSQSPGDASMRMFGGERPFAAVEKVSVSPQETPVEQVMRQARSIS